MCKKYCDRDWLYNQYIEQKKSFRQIGKDCGASFATIGYYAKKFNFKIRPKNEQCYLSKRNAPIEITEYMKEFLIGNILGDGSLSYDCRRKDSNFSSCSYSHSNKNKRILEYVSNELSEFGIKQMGKINKYCHKKLNSIYYTYWSRHYLELNKFKRYLYNQFNKKIIPRNLEFTPTICLHWYLGDGSLSKIKQVNCNKYYARICTQGFSKDDVEFAVSKFNSMGIDCSRQPSGNTIRFSTKGGYYGTLKFLNFIGRCPKEIEDIYGYKFLEGK